MSLTREKIDQIVGEFSGYGEGSDLLGQVKCLRNHLNLGLREAHELASKYRYKPLELRALLSVEAEVDGLPKEFKNGNFTLAFHGDPGPEKMRDFFEKALRNFYPESNS